MQPYYVLWEQSIGLKLLSKEEKPKLFAEFKVDGLLRGDFASRWQGYNTGLQNGVYCINDVRSLENLNPVLGGDAHHVQVNMGTIMPDGTIEPPKPAEKNELDPKPKEGEKNAMPREDQEGRGQEEVAEEVALEKEVRQNVFKGLIKDAIFRALWRERQSILPQAEKFLASDDLTGFASWLGGFYSDNQSYAERQVMPAFMALAQMVQADVAKRNNGDIGMTPEHDLTVRQYVSAFVLNYAQRNQNEVNEVAKQGVDAVKQLLDEWNRTKPQEVAEREAAAADAAFEDVAKRNIVTSK